MQNLKLNSGYQCPKVGLGTWRMTEKTKLKQVLEDAIKIGYRHLDCALVYENESMVGEILDDIYRGGKIEREDLFITSKLWNGHHKMAEWALKKTLKDLKTDYLDLYLIHWPVCFKSNDKGETIRKDGKPELDTYEIEKVWRQMESFVDQGLVRSIGVANHGIENLKKILSFCRIKPAMNQVEIHPYWKQEELIQFCKQNDIAVTSYSSIGSLKAKDEPRLIDDEVLNELAHSKNMTVPQLILGWLVSRDIVIIPKASSYERLQENFEVKMVDEDDRQILERLSTTYKYVDAPEFGEDRFK